MTTVKKFNLKIASMMLKLTDIYLRGPECNE